MKKQKTKYINQSQVQDKWLIIDAKDQVLGRLASNIAKQLMGKNSVQYTPSSHVGESIIVINASLIKVTGKKFIQKKYYRHSGYPGGLKEINFKDMLIKKPEQIILSAVKGMLPKNRLQQPTLKKLKVFSGDLHNHEAQSPTKKVFQ